ncbi:MAG: T9SS type A sorting domain-containing protein [Flavobacteriales bacterium]|nr:T9SS type A sorting domain-containing protein [Flavobacteriales bacterium]
MKIQIIKRMNKGMRYLTTSLKINRFIVIGLVLIHFFMFNNLCIAQNVNIPDANFKAALLSDPNINTNMDNEIQVSEAAALTGILTVFNSGIFDLTGIEAFTSITGLDCSYNNLSSLDLSANTALTYLECTSNQLTSLNISANTVLITLFCGQNQLSTLDVTANTSLNSFYCNDNQLSNLNITTNTSLSLLGCGYNQLSTLNVFNNTNLTELQCQYNQLTSIDVSNNIGLAKLFCNNNQLVNLSISNNTSLVELFCGSNQLTGLDITSNTSLSFLSCSNNNLNNLNAKNGNNVNFVVFTAVNNPNLTCIEVDDAAFMNNNWSNAKDSGTIYSENCSVSIEGIESFNHALLYPNPVYDDKFTVRFERPTVAQITIYSVEGKQLLVSQVKNTNVFELSISILPKGLYMVEIKSNNKKSVKKLIKN